MKTNNWLKRWKFLVWLTPKNISKFVPYFLICGWMFVLGVLVGRGTVSFQFENSKEKFHKELTDRKEADMKQEEEKYQIDKESLSKNPHLGFHEALKESGEESIDIPKAKPDSAGKFNLSPEDAERLALLKSQTSVDDKESNPTESPFSKEIPDGTSSTFSKGETDSSAKEGFRQSDVSMEALSDSEKNITVQVASFRDMTDADRFIEKLKGKGYPAYKVSAELEDRGIWYRVRVGFFKTKGDAQNMLEQLKKEDILPILVTVH